MLIDVIRFEWRYYTRQLSFAVAVLLFFGLGLALAGTGFGANNIHVNSPYSIFESFGLASLASVFIVAIFCADAVVRDRERQMEEIVFTTAVGKFDYLFGRFAGSFLAAFTAFSSCGLGMLFALVLPNRDPARIGAIHLGHYLWPLLVLVLPTMLLIAAVLFAIATLTRSVLASLVGAVLIYIFYLIASALTGSPLMAGSTPSANETPLASLFDPFALAPFFAQTRYWSLLERNTQLVSFTGTLLINRLLWLAVAAGIWLFVYRRFSFRQLREPQRAAVARVESLGPADVYRPVAVARDVRSHFSALRSATRLELRASITTIPFALLTLLWMALCATEIVSDVNGGEYGSALYPTTALILGAMQQPFTLIATVILIYFAAEICWRERSVGIAEVVNATPASNATFVVAKWLALSSMIVVLIAGVLVTGVLVQLGRGYARIELLDLLAGAWFDAAPLIVFAMLAMLVHALAPQKYVGMFVTLLLAIALPKTAMIGLEHPLWRFGSGPAVPFSEMNGFGHYAAPFDSYMLLWIAVGGLFLCAASLLWRRAPGDRVRHLGRTLRRTTARARLVTTAFALLAIATGAVIFYNTNVLNAYESRAALFDRRASYEKSYGRFATLPEPSIVGVRASVDLYPRERRYRITGEYALVNDTGVPIERVLVSIPREARVIALSMPGARPASDPRFGAHWFRPAQPLRPGQTAVLRFEIAYENRGFAADEGDTSIVANGSYLTSQQAFPTFGYRASYEIANARERQLRGLPPRRELDERDGSDMPAQNEWAAFDMTITTDADQTAVAPGRLVSSAEQGGRRTFHYRADAPIHNVFAIASARYASALANSGNVRIELLYDRHHQANVARILRAASDSLQLFQQTFGPYPYGDLRIVEVPTYVPFAGFADPGLIFLAEDRAFLTDARDPDRLDLVTRRVAHEVSHQWWGHGVAPANVEGASMITESLAKYSELLVLEKRYGRDAVPQSLGRELDLYLGGRTGDEREEVPLSRSLRRSYLYYRKGAIVMYAIKDLIGESAFHRALHDFYTAEEGSTHHATSADLVQQIEGAVSPSQRARIEEWVNDVVLYDLRLLSASARRRSDGRYEVTLRIDARKSRAGPGGNTTPIPFDESIDIALLGADSRGQLLHLDKHPLHGGLNVLQINVAQAPAVARIDPWITRLDRDRFDNEEKIADSGPG